MTDRIFDKTLDLMLAKAGEAAELAYMLYDVLGGDRGELSEEVGDLLLKYGYVDEDYMWKDHDD